MLVLTRRIDESVVIGDGITVTILGIDRNGQVRLGIDAPRSVRILRGELQREVADANAAAAANTAAAAATAPDLAQLARLIGAEPTPTPVTATPTRPEQPSV